MACRDICRNLYDTTDYKVKAYTVGQDAFKCRTCEIVIPYHHPLLKRNICPCCKQRLSNRYNTHNMKKYRELFEKSGIIRRI